MTSEEIIQFKHTIQETILPHVINLSNEKVAEMVSIIQNQNPELPQGFGSMLLEQLLQMKEKVKEELLSTPETSKNISSPSDASDAHDLTKLF
jgi:hypothetical protein